MSLRVGQGVRQGVGRAAQLPLWTAPPPTADATAQTAQAATLPPHVAACGDSGRVDEAALALALAARAFVAPPLWALWHCLLPVLSAAGDAEAGATRRALNIRYHAVYVALRTGARTGDAEGIEGLVGAARLAELEARRDALEQVEEEGHGL